MWIYYKKHHIYQQRSLGLMTQMQEIFHLAIVWNAKTFFVLAIGSNAKTFSLCNCVKCKNFLSLLLGEMQKLFVLTSVLHLSHICPTFVLHLSCICPTFVLHLSYIWGYLICKLKTRTKSLARDKHTSLFFLCIRDCINQRDSS
jgi:hypothetical protein